MIRDLISYKSSIDYKSPGDNKSFEIQKVAVEVMMNLNLGVFVVKTIAVEDLVLKTVEVDGDNIHTEIALIGLGMTLPR